MSPRRDVDVAIVGGGMVGAALAARLASRPATSGLRIALIEPRPARPPRPDDAVDLRVSAFSHAAVALIRDAGAWPRLAERRPAAYERMIVWDGASPPGGRDTLVFDAAEAGEPDLGVIAENRAVAAAFTERALALGVTLLASPVTGLTLEAEGARLVLGEQRLTAGLVVAADGADSPLRALAGIDGRGERYPQEAIVAHLSPERPHGGAARQRFLETGPLGLLPLADGRVSIVWSTRPELAAELAALDDDAFGAAVTEASDRVLGSLRAASPRGRFPLRRYQANAYHATRFVLVGDAAHAVHPLAGQGVNQGLLDVQVLADELAAALGRGEDVGDGRALGRYARERRAANVLMGEALNGLWHLFTAAPAFAGPLRRAGLALVERAGPAKRFFIRRALGQ